MSSSNFSSSVSWKRSVLEVDVLNFVVVVQDIINF